MVWSALEPKGADGTAMFRCSECISVTCRWSTGISTSACLIWKQGHQMWGSCSVMFGPSSLKMSWLWRSEHGHVYSPRLLFLSPIKPLTCFFCFTPNLETLANLLMYITPISFLFTVLVEFDQVLGGRSNNLLLDFLFFIALCYAFCWHTLTSQIGLIIIKIITVLFITRLVPGLHSSE